MTRASALPNPFAEALGAGRFCYVVELVASALRREAQVFEAASRLARVPGVVAGSITSYAGGAMGHDPMRIGAAARARGLTPNVHVTCVSQDRHGLTKTLEDLDALGIRNVFALTGDYPKPGTSAPAAPGPPGIGDLGQPAVFDLDSVQLVRLIAEMRGRGRPFHIAVAVSPFKYVEADCRYQYLKLENKIAAGADCAITQVGWDSRKLRELQTYLRERNLSIPLLGNVYVLGLRAAERMARGEPPGCWVAPALLERVREETGAADKGIGARLERAARLVAVLRGLGYAGAYLGGTHDAVHVAWAIRRAEELAPRWEELALEFTYGAPDGFYLYGPGAPGRPRAAAPDPGGPPRWSGRLAPRWLDLLSRLFPVTRDTWLRRALRAVSAWAARRPSVAASVERLELAIKRPVFGCQACGNCVLGHLQYVCPQTCPKQMRNGPCGGTHFGRCEVVDRPCIWVSVYERAAARGRVDDLRLYIPPPNRSLQGTSSWINYFLERDSRPREPRT
jgi:methylenetetrahydrofolate reductase (NADH)